MGGFVGSNEGGGEGIWREQRGGPGGGIFALLPNHVSDEECTALNSAWKGVKPDPVLPVQDGTELTLSCSADHEALNKGGNKATCQNGLVVPTKIPPSCIGKLSVLKVKL